MFKYDMTVAAGVIGRLVEALFADAPLSCTGAQLHFWTSASCSTVAAAQCLHRCPCRQAWRRAAGAGPALQALCGGPHGHQGGLRWEQVQRRMNTAALLWGSQRVQRASGARCDLHRTHSFNCCAHVSRHPSVPHSMMRLRNCVDISHCPDRLPMPQCKLPRVSGVVFKEQVAHLQFVPLERAR